MSARNILNEHPMATGGVVVALILLAVVLALRSSSGGSSGVGDAYYTTDDGATWFAADTKELPPIQHSGKPAVRAHLFAGEDGKKFVGYLERYTDEAKAVLTEADAVLQTGKMPDMGKAQAARMTGRQVKKPGDKAWISGTDMRNVMTVQRVLTPDGKPATAVE